MTAELEIPIRRNISLDSLMSKAGQILKTYRVVRLVIEGTYMRVRHVGRREDTHDTLNALIEHLDVEDLPWQENLLKTMLNATVKFNGFVVTKLFTTSKDVIMKAVGLDPITQLAHIVGAEIVETTDLRDYQIMLGMAPTYNATIGQLRKIILIELPQEESTDGID